MSIKLFSRIKGPIIRINDDIPKHKIGIKKTYVLQR